MITFFRNMSESWIVKGLLLLVTISMAGLFGLGSMTSMWGKDQSAIRVGNSSVKGLELVQNAEKEVRRINAMTGGRQTFTLNDAVKMGLVNKVVQSNINSLLYQTMADDMGLIASNEAVGNYIVNNPNFQTITGKFDRSLMVAYLQQMQMNEDTFTRALQEELSRKHLTDAVAAVIKVPPVLQDRVYEYVNEKRDIDVILLPTNAVKVTKVPDKETLQAYYDAMEEQLYAPEYRFISIVKLTPDKVAANIQVDEATLKQMYEDKMDLYLKPERRHLEQILVDSPEKAAALYKELTADNFEKVAKDKAGLDKAAIDLGWLERRGVVEDIGEAAFAAPVGKVLPPIETEFGYHIVVVRGIEKAEQTPFEKVKPDLIKAVQAEGAYDLLYNQSKKLDEALGEGKTLTDAATLIGATVEKVGFVDASGVDKKGKASGLPTDLLQSLFMGKSGEASPLFDYENGFIVGEVEAVEPVYLRPFDDVQKELKAEWLADEQKKAAPEFADRVFKAAQKDKVLKTVALFYHLGEESLKNVKRSDIADMSPEVIAKLFNAKVGHVELIEMADNDFVVAQVQKVIPADAKDEAAKMNLAIALKEQIVSSAVDEILAYYGDREKIEVNQTVIDEYFAPYMKQED